MYYYQIAMYKISIVSDLLIERSCKVTLMEIIHDLFPFSPLLTVQRITGSLLGSDQLILWSGMWM